MAPTRQSSTAKKRSRQDRSGENEREEVDVDLQSPIAKKRNTFKSPPPSSSAQRGTTSRSAAAAATTPSRRAANTRPSPVNEEEEQVYKGRNFSMEKDSDDDAEIEAPPPLSRSDVIIETTDKTAAATVIKSTPAAATSTIQSVKEVPIPEIEDDDDLDGKQNIGKDEQFTPGIRPPRLRRPNLRELCVLLLVLGILFSVGYLILWTAVALLDATDKILEVHQCRLQLLGDGDNSNTNYQSLNNNNNRQEDYVRQELETQLQYWKRHAKQNEAFARGYKDEYQAILQRLEGG
ncbi:hypothetical protein IV203_035807 [Nitzschia inconspicua]|uniref:Uncharacterized protein n=1 Tax=Nitzschia inconspicua TaxID=303405 RepID=A0A9K3LFQ1_9STRA|nr:hypothetical protein IV203_035807 [Nitzschia inconspicua]